MDEIFEQLCRVMDADTEINGFMKEATHTAIESGIDEKAWSEAKTILFWAALLKCPAAYSLLAETVYNELRRD